MGRLKSVTVMWPQADRKVTVNHENEKEQPQERSWELLEKWDSMVTSRSTRDLDRYELNQWGW